jgi:uncharacterized membrane protein YhiD involved in acid resistance
LPFPRVDVSTKHALAVGIGMLVGSEREWSQKDVGTRTFAIAAIAGTISVLAAPAFSSGPEFRWTARWEHFVEKMF